MKGAIDPGLKFGGSWNFPGEFPRCPLKGSFKGDIGAFEDYARLFGNNWRLNSASTYNFAYNRTSNWGKLCDAA